MIIEDNRIIADADKWLTNGDTTGKTVILGINDSAENWREITNEEMLEMECEMFG